MTGVNPARFRHFDHGFEAITDVPVPRRIIAGCDACDNGCTCTPDSPGCEHYACWGADPTGACPFAAFHRQATIVAQVIARGEAAAR